jgi:HEAT repeat protein
MKLLHPLLVAVAIAAPARQLQALDGAALNAIAAKFANESTDEQYNARVELNLLVNRDTAPGVGDPVAVSRTLAAALAAEDVVPEAKKYILRALARIGTAEAIDAAAALLAGPDPMLAEEARQVLESIPDPRAVAILEKALAALDDKRMKLGLINSLAMQEAAGSMLALAKLAVDPDPDLARAAIAAMGKIGGEEGISMLGRAYGSSKVAEEVKVDVERALLVAGLQDGDLARRIFESTGAAPVRLAAFSVITAGDLDADDQAIVETALKSDDELLRQAALRRAIEAKLTSVTDGLADSVGDMPKGDRLVVLSSAHLLEPAETAEAVALAAAASEDRDERIAALQALGRIATKPAFEAVLAAVADREPPINQAAAGALAKMDYADADAALLAMLEGESGADRILAIKAVAHRQVPDANSVLMKIITGDDSEAAAEAARTIYFTATIEDLGKLSDAANEAAEPSLKRTLKSICTKIASRIDTDEARELVDGIK